MGNGNLRRLLVVGASSVTRRAPTNVTRTAPRFRRQIERKPTLLMNVATANTTARTATALLAKEESFRVAPAI
jgi:transposase